MVRILLPLGALIVGGPTTFLGILLAQEAGRWLAGRLALDQPFATHLYTGAYAVRALLAIVLYVAYLPGNGDGAVLPDEYSNDIAAQWLVRIAHGEGLALFTAHKHVVDNGYPLLLAGLYAVVGYVPLLPKLLDAVVGGLVAVVVAEIARRAYGGATGRLSGTIAAFLPSLVFWTALALKEAMVLLGAVLALAGTQSLLLHSVPSRRVGNQVVVLVVGLALLADLRAPIALFVVLAAAGAFALLHLLRHPALGLAMAGVVLVVLVGGIAASRTVARPLATALVERVEATAQGIRHRRGWEAYGARSQLPGADSVIGFTPTDDPSNPDVAYREEPFRWSSDVLGPLAATLLYPLPWEAESLRDLAAAGEMPIWYALLAASLVALARPSRSDGTAYLLVGFGLLTWALLAASEGNVGNLVRHRMLLDPTVVVLGSVGTLRAWAWLARRRGRRAAATSVPERGGRLTAPASRR